MHSVTAYSFLAECGRSRKRFAFFVATSGCIALAGPYWVCSYGLYPSLLEAIIIVQPETVIRWHRRGFRAYWRWKSCHVVGRPRMDSGIRALIRRMNHENPLWGAPQIHGELLMLVIEVAESTVGR
jgi:hypothetical protein